MMSNSAHDKTWNQYWQARGFQLYVFSGRISLSVSFHLLLLALRGHLPPAGCLLA